MSKIAKIAIIMFLILDVSFIVFLAQNNNKIIEDNERLIGKNKEMSDKVVEMLTDDEVVQVLQKECEFTATYRVIDNLKYTGDDKDMKYVILDKYIENKPFILSYKNQTFEKGKYYEIKFQGTVGNTINDFNIMTITKTDKEGLEQVNEKCE